MLETPAVLYVSEHPDVTTSTKCDLENFPTTTVFTISLLDINHEASFEEISDHSLIIIHDSNGNNNDDIYKDDRSYSHPTIESEIDTLYSADSTASSYVCMPSPSSFSLFDERTQHRSHRPEMKDGSRSSPSVGLRDRPPRPLSTASNSSLTSSSGGSLLRQQSRQFPSSVVVGAHQYQDDAVFPELLASLAESRSSPSSADGGKWTARNCPDTTWSSDYKKYEYNRRSLSLQITSPPRGLFVSSINHDSDDLENGPDRESERQPSEVYRARGTRGGSFSECSYIDRVVMEILETERTYVKDLHDIIKVTKN